MLQSCGACNRVIWEMKEMRQDKEKRKKKKRRKSMEKQEEEEEDVKEEQLQCEALSFFVEIFESPALFELAFKCLGYMTSLPLISQSFTKIIP